MIYLENSTEEQTIYIPRENSDTQSIKPIPTDVLADYYTKKESNNIFATKQEVNEKVANLQEQIDNGGGSTSNVVYIYAQEDNNITDEQWLEIVENYPNKNYKIVTHRQSFEENGKEYKSETIVEVVGVDYEQYPQLEDNNGNVYNNCTLGYISGYYDNTNFTWSREFGDYGYEMFLREEGIPSSQEVNDLKNRVTELENNGGSGGDNNIYTYTETEYDNGDTIYSSLSVIDYEDIINRFPTQQIVIYNTKGNFKVNIVNIINTGYNNGLFGYYIIDDTEFGIIRYFFDKGVIKYTFEENVYEYYTNFYDSLDMTNSNLGKLTDRVEELENNSGGGSSPINVYGESWSFGDNITEDTATKIVTSRLTLEQFDEIITKLTNNERVIIKQTPYMNIEIVSFLNNSAVEISFMGFLSSRNKGTYLGKEETSNVLVKWVKEDVDGTMVVNVKYYNLSYLYNATANAITNANNALEIARTYEMRIDQLQSRIETLENKIE